MSTEKDEHSTLVEITDKCGDPSNADVIIDKLQTFQQMDEVLDYVYTIFPEWIVTCLDTLSQDYPHLTSNWHTVCSKIGVNPAQVMIVEDMVDDSKHRVVTHFCELFTRAGFVVRRKREFIPCTRCFRTAVPTETVYNVIKSKGLSCPPVWSQYCKECR